MLNTFVNKNLCTVTCLKRPHYIGAEYGFIRGIQGAGEIHTMGRNLPVKFNELPVNIMIPC